MPKFSQETVMSYDYVGLSDENKELTETANRAFGAIRDTELMANLKENVVNFSDVPSILELFNTLSGSVLVVAGGPSFIWNIENIREAQEAGAFILAVDRVFSPLKQNGIVPDITVTTDPFGDVKNFFEWIEPGDRVCVFMAQRPSTFKYIEDRGGEIYGYMHTNPSSEFASKIYYGIHELLSAEHQKKLKKYYGLRCDYVVTSATIDLAYWMGAETVMAIGNELSWNHEEEMEPDHKLHFQNNAIYIDFPDGTSKLTMSAFLLSAFATSFFPWRRPDVDWVDLSDGIMQGWQSSDFDIEIPRIRSEK